MVAVDERAGAPNNPGAPPCPYSPKCLEKLSEKGSNGTLTYAPTYEKELPYRSYRSRVEVY
jgi:hypothetical protein